MKQLLIPTRDNSWMYVVWLPLVMFFLTEFGRLHQKWVYISYDVIGAVALLWMVWRMAQKSSVSFEKGRVILIRGNRSKREIPVEYIERMMLNKGTFSIFLKPAYKRPWIPSWLPSIGRSIQMREMEERNRLQQSIQQWARRHKIPVQDS